MKHLKKFNEEKEYESIFETLNPNEVKELYSRYINWELIEDAKELSLYYLDEGLSLELYFKIDKKIIYTLYYNHHENIEYYSSLMTNPYNINRRYVLYIEMDSEKYKKDKKSNDVLLSKYRKEITERLRYIYKNENINETFKKV